MKQCPGCGWEVHDRVTTCPECGGTWDPAGRFSASADTYVARPAGPPENVGEMTPAQLRETTLWASFWGALMAGGLLVFILIVVELVLNAE